MRISRTARPTPPSSCTRSSDERRVRRRADDDPGIQDYHTPVLVREVLALLEPERGGLFVDGTVGGGGHARAILERAPGVHLVAVDRDPGALAEAERTLAPFGDRVRFLLSDFRHAARAPELDEGAVSGVLLDLGVSSRQLDHDRRGFAFRRGVPLDMRMDGSDARTASAADVLNSYDEGDLARVFRELGEHRGAHRLARRIVRRRRTRPFAVSDDLVGALRAAMGRSPAPRDKARVFQALRLEVNDELGALREGLDTLRDTMDAGGRMAVISYHSLEDREVKNRFREWSRDCTCPPALPVCVCAGRAAGETLVRRPVRPAPTETSANPRARSARLRAWRKTS
ncbi:MAG: 16S rRNA (cytosine(1402)-N(4))-methyltransferase RsmH [Gammaproteobacteria bacterium]|nr:16S rRNA (cytosine(1402)-N(4))-methyltransferase RsmH [Gammaproteobacteria bacterium]MYC52688.1 16S rRNA (cytosine(1402)-N(4))-methyltransferase RsmH [Gammaproteobacteria bacterium]